MPIQPITIEKLKPFPLPKELATLPSSLIDQLSSLYELTTGFVTSLETYKTHEQEVVDAVNKNISTINDIVDLLSEYETRSEVIAGLIKQLEQLYKEFLALETRQFQLLSANYNTNVLRTKLEKLAKESDANSSLLARSYMQTKDSLANDLLLFLHTFKDSRKEYHLRRERLYRWEEERVAGLL